MNKRHVHTKAEASILPAHDRWLLSYADFVTLLLAVFIVLFASVRHNHGSLVTVSTAIHSGFNTLGLAPGPVQDRINERSQSTLASRNRHTPDVASQKGSELASQLQNGLADAINKQQLIVQPTSDGLTIRLQELGSFASGNAALLPDAVQNLQRTARILERYDLQVRVEGHSDDQPIRTAAFHSNWELSTARAMSVLTALVDQAGFPPNRIAVVGYGPYRPISENTTEEGRRKNRRVDLVIITASRQDTSR